MPNDFYDARFDGDEDDDNLNHLQDPDLDIVEENYKQRWYQESKLDDGVRLFLGAVVVVLGAWLIYFIADWIYTHLF